MCVIVAWRQLKKQPGHFQRLQQRLETNQGCKTTTSYSVRMLTAVFWQLIWNRRMRIVDFSNVMVRWSAESLIQIKWKLKKKIRNPLTAFNLFSVRTNRLHYKKHNICFYAISLTNLNVTVCSVLVSFIRELCLASRGSFQESNL